MILSDTAITDAALPNLEERTGLKKLYLCRDQITDAGLEHLKGLTNLKELHLQGTQVTDEGVKKLQQALPNCNIGY